MRIHRDIHCRECEYNLRGLTRAGRCPECGLPVADTLSYREQRIAPAILQARKGLEFAVFAHLLVLAPLAPMLLDQFAGTAATAVLAPFIFLILIAALMLALLATQIIADAIRQDDRSGMTHAKTIAVRLLVPLLFAASFLTPSIMTTRTGGRPISPPSALFLLALAGASVATFSYFSLLETIRRRSGAPEHLLFFCYALAILAPLAQLGGFALPYAGPLGVAASMPIFLLIGGVLGLTGVSLVLHIRLLQHLL